MTLNPTNASIIKRLLVGRNNRPLQAILSRLAPPDLAVLVGMLNERENRLLIEALISIGKAGTCLLELPEQKVLKLSETIGPHLMLKVLQDSSPDDASQILSGLSVIDQKDLLDQLEPTKKRRIQQLLNYPEESAGRIMNSQFFSISIELPVNECLETIRRKSQEISIYYIYCVDEAGHLVGVVSLRDLVTASPETKLSRLAKRDIIKVLPTTSDDEVAQLASRYDFVAIPVVNEDGRMIGLITVDDILDILQDQATANIYASAGLQEDDRVYSPTSRSIKNRLPWMLLNLFLAAIASSVISLFESTMSELIILASLNNIVAGMAGNTAIQTLTVVTRGLAIGDFDFISKARGILKETLVGLGNGLITGLAAGLLVYLWKDSLLVGAVICISMSLNAIVASLFGASIPLVLRRFGLDPAAGAGVLVTMLTDIFGFFSFLGLAALGLHYFSF